MNELTTALQAALSGNGSLVMLTGEPGCGKTRTSQELAAHARQNNCKVIWGRCNENPGAPPYWPWVQVIRSYIRETDAESVYRAMGDGAIEIAEIAPEIRSQLVGLGPYTPIEDADQARFRLFDSITNFFKNASQSQPMLLFLDDLHWADKPSLLLLEFLTYEISNSPLLIVGTYRDIELSRRHPLSDTLAELNRERLFQRVQLRGLDLDEVATFIGDTLGVTPPFSLVSAIHRQTEGNPLFVTEVVRLLMEEGELTPEHLQQSLSLSISIPNGVREAIGRRLNRLSENCIQALRVASVIGREFGVVELERILSESMSEDDILDALDEAEAAKIIEGLPQIGDRFQFTHVLIRETLYDELTGPRRTRLHRRIGEAMEDIYQTNMNHYLAQLAHHFSEAVHAGGAAKAVHYATRAAERDLTLLAYEEAIRHYEMALQAQETDISADQAVSCKLLLSLGESYKIAGDFRQAMETFQKAADLSRELGSSEFLVSAAIGFEDSSWRPGQFGQPAAQLLEEALTLLEEKDNLLRPRVMASMVRALYFSGLQDRAHSLGEQAIEAARRSGDPETLAYVLHLTIYSTHRPEHFHRRLTQSTELLDLAANLNDTDAALDIYSWHMSDLLEIGDSPRFGRFLDVFQLQAEQLRQPFHLYVAQSVRSSLAIAEGRFDEAEQCARQALQIGQRLKGQDPSGIFGMNMFTIYKEQGRLEEVAPAMSVFLQQHSANSAWRPGLALIYSELGMEAETRLEFENLAADDFSGLPQDALLVVCLSYLSEVCAFLGDVRRAEILYHLLQSWNGHNVVVPGGAAFYGSASRYLGLLAATSSRWDDAEQHFQLALEMDAAMNAKTWLTHTQHDYAKMLLARNQSQDLEKAMSLLDLAISNATELGMRAMEDRIRTLQTQVEPQHRRTPEYPDGLTQREVEVLRLITTGKTNREVAEELFISVGTVSTHVKNLLNKTSCANRTEAATYAARHGLV